MICTIREIPIYYEEIGEGKPILCIHGYTLDHRMTMGCMEPVFKQKPGYRRIYIDVPGMGKTPSAQLIKTADETLEVIIEFINAVIPHENFLIMGQSNGGYLTLGILSKLKEKIDGVLLLAPQMKTWRLMAQEEGLRPQKQVVYRSEDLGGMENEPDFESFLTFAAVVTPEVYERFKAEILPGIKLADMQFLFGYYDGAFNDDFEERLKKLTFDKPACIITGLQDNGAGFKDQYLLLERFPRATYAVLDCAGHNLQIEQGPLFSELVKNWLWRASL